MHMIHKKKLGSHLWNVNKNGKGNKYKIILLKLCTKWWYSIAHVFFSFPLLCKFVYAMWLHDCPYTDRDVSSKTEQVQKNAALSEWLEKSMVPSYIICSSSSSSSSSSIYSNSSNLWSLKIGRFVPRPFPPSPISPTIRLPNNPLFLVDLGLSKDYVRIVSEMNVGPENGEACHSLSVKVAAG